MKKFAFFLVFMLLMFCAAHKNAQAQGVVTGISICEYNIPSNVVNGYSETVNDYTASLYYGVYTEGYLYENLSLVQSFASGPASVSAVVLTQDPSAVQDTQYDLFTNHYVVCIYYIDAFPNYYGRDVLGYNFLSNVEVPNSYPFLASGPEAFLLNTVYEYLGSTRVTVGYFPPRLDFINPNWGYERGQVDVTLTGHNVDADNFNTPVRVNVTGGITATVLSINPTTLTARFQIPDNLTGEQQVTITSTHGTSNPLNFIAVDRQPQITGISPSSLDAGTTTSVTVDGTDFGANPDVEILGGVQYSVTSKSDTRITADVSVPADAPGGDLLITVISRGANGTGFLPGPPNTPPRSNTEPVQVRPVTLTGVTAQGALLVTKVIGNQSIFHFVTPKKSKPTDTDNVTLTAFISPFNEGTVNQISWEGATQDTTDKRMATVSKGSAAKFVVKVKISGQVAKELRVWVVWATITAPTETAIKYEEPVNIDVAAGKTGAFISGGYGFLHKIAPSEIITDSDRPDLSGNKTTDPPGDRNPFNGGELKGGADKMWDNSRQFRMKVLNPAGIAASDFSQPPPINVPDYPSNDNDVEGNDDTSVIDEINDPYSNSANLIGIDTPGIGIAHSAGADNVTFELRLHFREFTRLELQGTWFRISDYFPWRIHIKFKKVAGKWVNDGSNQAKDNNGF